MHGCIQIYKSIITKMTGNFCIVDTTYLGSFDVWQIYWVHYRGLERGSPRNICWLGRRDEWGGGSQSHQMGEDLYCWRGNLFLVDHYQSVIEINLNFFSSNHDCMKIYLVGKCEIQQHFLRFHLPKKILNGYTPSRECTVILWNNFFLFSSLYHNKIFHDHI